MRILNEQDILNDPAISNWLKEQIVASKDRDVVDAINDVSILLKVLHERFEACRSNVFGES